MDDPKKKAFRPRVDDKLKVCYNYGEKGHISPNFPMPDKRKIKGKPSAAARSCHTRFSKNNGKPNAIIICAPGSQLHTYDDKNANIIKHNVITSCILLHDRMSDNRYNKSITTK